MIVGIDRQRIFHKRDRLRQLRVFCHAAQFQSFARAADRLDISPSAVSTHVRALEYELEVTLFERGSARSNLTSAGETLYVLAEPLVQGMDALPDVLVESIGNPVSGCFELAATSVATSFVLPPYVKRFRDRYPETRVRVRNCLFREGMRLLLDKDVEFLLGAKDLYPQNTVRYDQLFSYAMVLITPLDHPLAGRDTVQPEEVAQWPAVAPPDGMHTRQFEEVSPAQCGVDRNAEIEVRGWKEIKRYVELGFGISMIPSICVSKSDRLSVISLPDHFPSLSFGVFTRRDRTLDPLAQRFLRLMFSDFPSFAPQPCHVP